MLLGQQQELFVQLLGDLFRYAYEHGFRFRLGDGLRRDRKGHMANSLHYEALAQDLNLFIGGAWITNGGHWAWKELSAYWLSLHPLCASGIKFGDANHFSLRRGGRQLRPGVRLAQEDRCMPAKSKAQARFMRAAAAGKVKGKNAPSKSVAREYVEATGSTKNLPERKGKRGK